MAVAVAGLNYAVWMDDLALDNLLWGEITAATANTIVVSYGPGTRDEFYGSLSTTAPRPTWSAAC